jgi:hypothetical protein
MSYDNLNENSNGEFELHVLKKTQIYREFKTSLIFLLFFQRFVVAEISRFQNSMFSMLE